MTEPHPLQNVLTRIADALDRFVPTPDKAMDLSVSNVYIWQGKQAIVEQPACIVDSAKGTARKAFPFIL